VSALGRRIEHPQASRMIDALHGLGMLDERRFQLLIVCELGIQLNQ